MTLPRFTLAGLIAVLAISAGIPAAHAQVSHNQVTLSWTTPGDDGTIGNAAQFDLRYSTSPITASNFASATRWNTMPTPGAPGTKQTVTVTGLLSNTTYYFAIKTADEVPNWSGLSNVFSATTSTAPDLSRPAPLALSITSVTDTTALLGWNATGDDSLTGTASSYDIRYSTALITESNWASATQVTGEPTPASAGTPQTYLVRNLNRGVRYYFAAKAIDNAGHVSALSNVPNVVTPDTMAPAAITDLAVGWTFIGWRSTHALRPRAPESR